MEDLQASQAGRRSKMTGRRSVQRCPAGENTKGRREVSSSDGEMKTRESREIEGNLPVSSGKGTEEKVSAIVETGRCRELKLTAAVPRRDPPSH